MATNNELATQVKSLSERVLRLQASNSDLRDEVALLKNNYDVLVKESVGGGATTYPLISGNVTVINPISSAP